MAKKKSFWQYTTEELVEKCKMYDIPYDEKEFNRKEIIPQIAEAASAAGDLTEAVGFDDEGNEMKTEGEEMIAIYFYQQEGATRDVFLGHNGHNLFIPREVNVRIPKKFMSVIRDAVQLKVVPKKLPDGKTKGITEMRVPRFQYHLVDEVKKD